MLIVPVLTSPPTVNTAGPDKTPLPTLTVALLVLDYILLAPNLRGTFFAGKVTIILYFFLQITFLSALRLAYRYFRYTRVRAHARSDGASPTLLIGRAADPAGLSGWVGLMQAGATEAQVATSIISSPEYSLLHSSNTAFVQSLYQNLLGRTPSTADLNSAVTSLATQSRASLANFFVNATLGMARIVTGKTIAAATP